MYPHCTPIMYPNMPPTCWAGIHGKHPPAATLRALPRPPCLPLKKNDAQGEIPAVIFARLPAKR